LFGGHAAELAEKFGGDADGDELFRVAGGGAADSVSAAEFGWGRFGDVREIELAIRLSFAKTPHEAILVHVTCYAVSSYVIDFTCALDFGEAQRLPH
jgi:hypothetical protein